MYKYLSPFIKKNIQCKCQCFDNFYHLLTYINLTQKQERRVRQCIKVRQQLLLVTYLPISNLFTIGLTGITFYKCYCCKIHRKQKDFNIIQKDKYHRIFKMYYNSLLGDEHTFFIICLHTEGKSQGKNLKNMRKNRCLTPKLSFISFHVSK